jgi:bifunctional oligoribonuclease and PAP phosphatase NrnA
MHIAPILRSLKGKTIVLSHHNADADTIASATIMADMLGCDVGVPDSISSLAKQVLEAAKVRREVLINPRIENYTNVITLDVASPEQLLPMKIHGDQNLIVIDHHSPGKLVEMAKDFYVDPNGKAASLIVSQLMKFWKIKPTHQQAFLLMAGIITDTAHLRLADKKVFEAMLELMELVDYHEVLAALQSPPDFSERIAALKALTRARVWRVGGTELIVALSYIKSHEAPAARGLLHAGADLAVVIAKRENEIRISSRGKKTLDGKIHLANDVFGPLGPLIKGNGGGHDLAGSANGSDPKSAQRAEDFILRRVAEKLGRLESIN